MKRDSRFTQREGMRIVPVRRMDRLVDETNGNDVSGCLGNFFWPKC